MPNPPRRRWRSSAVLQSRARELRRALTPAEHTLWQQLRVGRLARYNFRRQHPVGRFIVDFYCPATKLVIEVDGDSHAEQTHYDAERTRWLNEQKHFRVIRFTNDDVHHRSEAVVGAIIAAVKRPPPQPSSVRGSLP